GGSVDDGGSGGANAELDASSLSCSKVARVPLGTECQDGSFETYGGLLTRFCDRGVWEEAGLADNEWEICGVGDMSNWFRVAGEFNGDISAWNTSKVTNMSGTFSFAESFNQDLSAWNTSGVTMM